MMADTTRQYTAGLRIAGIGGTTKNTPTVWAKIGAQRLIDALSLNTAQDWIADCLVTLPDTVERRVDPWASRYETSPMSFELSMERVGGTIPVQAWEPLAQLLADVAEDATSLTLNRSGLANTLIYVGDETIKLNGDADLGGGVWFYTCTRGYNGSRAQEHPAQDAVFASPPYWMGRRVELVVVRGDSATPRVIWSGFISDVRTSEYGTRLVLGCREIMDGLVERQLNTGAPDLAATGAISVELYNLFFLSGVIPFESRVHKAWTAPRTIALQVGGALYLVPQTSPGTLDLALARQVAGDLGMEGEVGQDATLGQLAPLTKPVYELLVVSKDLDTRFGDVSVTTPLPLAWRYHPLALAFAILCSTPRVEALVDTLEPDILAPAWGCPIWDWLDVEGWSALIDATPEVQIDQLFWGWDAASPGVMDRIVEVLLRPYGFFLALTEDGRLGVSRLVSPTIRELCEAADRQLPLIRPRDGGQFEWLPEIGTAVGEVTALVGAVPWSDEPSTVTIRLTKRTPRSAQFADSRIYAYDFSTKLKASVASFADGDGGDALAVQLIDRAIRASWALPRLQITAPDARSVDPALRYNLGTFVTFEGASLPPAPVFRLPTGERVDPTDPDYSVYFLGQVMAARLNLPTQTWDLELLLLAWRTGSVARFRAPAARIEAYYTTDPPELEIWADSDFGGSDTDAVGFTAGDQVVFVDEDGEDSGEIPRTITGRLDRILLLDLPTAGDVSGLIVTLAPSTVYANAFAVPGAECVTRPWVYLADDNDEIDRPGPTVEPADRYG